LGEAVVLKIGPKAIATKRQRKRRGQYLGGKPMFGSTHDADRKMVPDPAQQR
jgi:hypothetical protein